MRTEYQPLIIKGLCNLICTKGVNEEILDYAANVFETFGFQTNVHYIQNGDEDVLSKIKRIECKGNAMIYILTADATAILSSKEIMQFVASMTKSEDLDVFKFFLMEIPQEKNFLRLDCTKLRCLLFEGKTPIFREFLTELKKNTSIDLQELCYRVYSKIHQENTDGPMLSFTVCWFNSFIFERNRVSKG